MRVAPEEPAPCARRGKSTQRQAERAALEGVTKVPNREDVKSPCCNDEACSRDSRRIGRPARRPPGFSPKTRPASRRSLTS
jgi:hypothetical protein